MREASLQSSAVMGNFDSGAEADEDLAGQASASASSGSVRAVDAVDTNAAFPALKLTNLRSFVISQQVFSHSHDSHGVAHLSFMLDRALSDWNQKAVLSASILRDAAKARRTSKAGRNLSLVSLEVPQHRLEWMLGWCTGKLLQQRAGQCNWTTKTESRLLCVSELCEKRWTYLRLTLYTLTWEWLC